jgi:hypothetical protein
MSKKEMSDDQPIICIFGSYSPESDHPEYEQAYAIGHALASAGFVVCNGGYEGTMAASARGAKDAGGSTIGVTCNIFGDYRGKPMQPNPWIDREIAHASLLPRIEAMMTMSAGYVILPGGTGTLAELAVVWEFVAKKLIDPRPIICVGQFWKPTIDAVTAVRPKHGKHVYFIESTEKVLPIIASYYP